MQMTTRTLEKAVFKILDETGVGPNSTIPLTELRAHWAHTGLRADDLRDALRVMFEQRHVDFRNDGHGLAVLLTPAGYEHARSWRFTPATLLSDARDRIALRRAARRGSHWPVDTSEVLHRRKADRARAG